MKKIRKLINKTNTPPFDKKLVTIKTQDYPRSNFIVQLARILRKYLLLFVSFQYKYLKQRISINEKNILWIHNTTENIGDSLMKTSSIRYLKSNGYSVDLCVLPKLYDLYKNNSYCRNVIKLDNLANLSEKYDLIILDSLSSKCMKIKMKYYYSKPFVTIYDFYNYFRPDYNLILFSWYRMQYLLNKHENIDNIAKPFVGKLSVKNIKINNLNIKNKSIAIVCGGINNYRIYPNWIQVIELIDRNNIDTIPIVLVGSENGIEYSNQIINHFSNRGNLIDTVGKFTIIETKSIINSCELVVGADGGILQLASALDKKIIALFAQIDSRLRFTEATEYKYLYDDNEVKNIKAKDITNEILIANMN
jgi:ADP-heptose:LPS heptosyltransferase